MLDRAYRLSSSWAYFSGDCECLKSLFSRFKYPQHLINSTINPFVNSRVTGQHPSQASVEMVGNDVTRVVIPFKDQDPANFVNTQLKDLSLKLQTTVQPVFVGRKIGQDLQECETKPQLVNQQCVVYHNVTCAIQVAMLATRLDGHNSTSSSIRKHYDQDLACAVPEDLLSCFTELKKCMNNLGSLVNETLYIKQIILQLNEQTESIRVKVFGSVFTTAVALLNIPENGLFADFVQRLKNDTCFHG